MLDENTTLDIEKTEQNEKEKLPFAKAMVVRLMKENLSKDKMISERVKVEMNKFLYKILREVCQELDKYPYTTIDYEMFKESVYPYTNIQQINQERERIIMHLNGIKADCDALTMDVSKTLKINEEDKEDDFVPITNEVREGGRIEVKN